MHIREANTNDFADIGIIQAECNKTDTLARYFIKDMDKYPTTYRRGSIKFVKRRAATPGSITFVVETDEGDYDSQTQHPSSEVVGFAIWTRIGTSPTAKGWQDRNTAGLWTKLNRLLESVEDRYYQFFPTVECTFKPHLFRQVLPVLSIPFDHEVFAEAWELELLFVMPGWQRRGIGKMLMEWGVEQATKEQVPLTVKSSPKGAAAYRAFGFQSLGEVGLDKIFDPLEFGGEMPQLWCYEPEGCKGRFYERGKTALEKLKKETRENETDIETAKEKVVVKVDDGT